MTDGDYHRAPPSSRRAVGAALGVFVVVVLIACGGRDGDAERNAQATAVTETGSYTNIDPAELSRILGQKDFILVNVHVPYQGEIVGTDLFIPYDQIAQNLDVLPADTNAKIVLYCQSGRMSDIAARTLVSRGYANVRNLDGGMIGWEQAGFPLADQGR